MILYLKIKTRECRIKEKNYADIIQTFYTLINTVKSKQDQKAFSFQLPRSNNNINNMKY